MDTKKRFFFFVLYNKRIINWYLSSTSDEIFVLCVATRIFLSVYFLCIWVWCLTIVVRHFGRLRFEFHSLTGRLLVWSLNTPKMYRSLFIKLVESDGGSLLLLDVTSWRRSEMMFMTSSSWTVVGLHHDDDVRCWNTFWGQIKIFYIQKHVESVNGEEDSILEEDSGRLFIYMWRCI